MAGVKRYMWWAESEVGRSWWESLTCKEKQAQVNKGKRRQRHHAAGGCRHDYESMSVEQLANHKLHQHVP